MSWLVYRLSGSVVLLATVNFMAQIPILLITPFVSVYVDRFDRRKILLLTQTLSMVQALALALLALTGIIQIWHILLLSFSIGCINALDNPTRQAFYPGLVAKEHLSNAIALNSAVINSSRLIGPAIGGLLIGLCGEGLCFLLNGLSYIGIITALLAMHPQPSVPRNHPLHLRTDLSEGFQYISGHTPIRTLLLFICVISFFGLPLTTFIPAYVKDILHAGSEELGLLLSCSGIGSFGAALYLAGRKEVAGLWKVISTSGILLSIGLIGISSVETIPIAACIYIAIGFTLISAVASVNTLLQTLSDEDKRGRVMGYLAMAFTGLPPIGSLFLSSLEKYTGLPVIILISGVGCILGSIVFEYYRTKMSRFVRHIPSL